MKKLWIGFTGLVFALTLFSTATAKTKWDMHLNYPAGNFHTEGAQKFADEVFAREQHDPSDHDNSMTQV